MNDDFLDPITKIVNEALEILLGLGVPLEGLTPRRKVKMAKAFIAVAGLEPGDNWASINVDNLDHRPRSRDCIKWMNDYLGEEISLGSYDDIRRKDLLLPVEAGIVLKAAGNEDAATNDGTRGYGINPDFADQIRRYGTQDWLISLDKFMAGKVTLIERLNQRRSLALVPVTIGNSKILFSAGEHNQIQKSVIEQFLPRFGYEAEVLYVGDTTDKYLYLNISGLEDLNFFEISHDKLPDVLAYSKSKNWLYLIEAVHSANPIDRMRKMVLSKLAERCSASIVFVTAFTDRKTFRKFAADVAWETEVWLADEPDHMVHFNGDKFLGPHS